MVFLKKFKYEQQNYCLSINVSIFTGWMRQNYKAACL